MEIKLKNYIAPGKVIGFVHFPGSFAKLNNNKKISYITDEMFHQNISVQKYLEKHIPSFSVEKFEQACKMTLFDQSVLSRCVCHLSKTEMKKLRLVEGLLLNSETLVLVNFERGFYGKSRNYFQKLFLKLTKYGKCIIFISNDLEFLMGITKTVFLFTSEQVLSIDNYYDSRFHDWVDLPDIISFVKMLRSKGIGMDEYIERKEVLKAIYRSVTSGEKL